MRKLFTFYTSFILLYPLAFSQTPFTFQDATQQAQHSSITNLTQPDGTIKFTTVEQAYSSLIKLH